MSNPSMASPILRPPHAEVGGDPARATDEVRRQRGRRREQSKTRDPRKKTTMHQRAEEQIQERRAGGEHAVDATGVNSTIATSIAAQRRRSHMPSTTNPTVPSIAA